MDAVFYFSFYGNDNDDDGCPTLFALGFYINNIRKPWRKLEDELADVAFELESEYGAHDLAFTPSGVNAIGYHSSEVGYSRSDKLMDVWRQAFVQHAPGCVVSDVFELPHPEKMNDAAILQFTKNAHEQFVAEQQRDTLNDSISPVSSPASRKKM